VRLGGWGREWTKVRDEKGGGTREGGEMGQGVRGGVGGGS